MTRRGTLLLLVGICLLSAMRFRQTAASRDGTSVLSNRDTSRVSSSNHPNALVDILSPIGGTSMAATVEGCSGVVGIGPRIVRVDACSTEGLTLKDFGPMLSGTVGRLAISGSHVFATTRDGSLSRASFSNWKDSPQTVLGVHDGFGYIAVSDRLTLVADTVGTISVIDETINSELSLRFQVHLRNIIPDSRVLGMAMNADTVFVLTEDTVFGGTYLTALDVADFVVGPQDVEVKSRLLASERGVPLGPVIMEDKVYIMQADSGILQHIGFVAAGELEILEQWDINSNVGVTGTVAAFDVDSAGVLVAWARERESEVRRLTFGEGGIMTSWTIRREGWSPDIVSSGGPANRGLVVDSHRSIDLLSAPGESQEGSLASVTVPSAPIVEVAASGETGSVLAVSRVTGLWTSRRGTGVVAPMQAVDSRISRGVSFLPDGRYIGLSSTGVIIGDLNEPQQDEPNMALEQYGVPPRARIRAHGFSGHRLGVAYTPLGSRGSVDVGVVLIDFSESDMGKQIAHTTYKLSTPDIPVSMAIMDNQVIVSHLLSEASSLRILDTGEMEITSLGADTSGIVGLSARGGRLVASRDRQLVLFGVSPNSGTLMKQSQYTAGSQLSSVTLSSTDVTLARLRTPFEAAVGVSVVEVLSSAPDGRFSPTGIQLSVPGLVADIEKSANGWIVGTKTAGVVYISSNQPVTNMVLVPYAETP